MTLDELVEITSQTESPESPITLPAGTVQSILGVVLSMDLVKELVGSTQYADVTKLDLIKKAANLSLDSLTRELDGVLFTPKRESDVPGKTLTPSGIVV